MSASVLILFAHPCQHRSEVNLPPVEASRMVSDVSVMDLYAENLVEADTEEN